MMLKKVQPNPTNHYECTSNLPYFFINNSSSRCGYNMLVMPIQIDACAKPFILLYHEQLVSSNIHKSRYEKY